MSKKPVRLYQPDGSMVINYFGKWVKVTNGHISEPTSDEIQSASSGAVTVVKDTIKRALREKRQKASA